MASTSAEDAPVDAATITPETGVPPVPTGSSSATAEPSALRSVLRGGGVRLLVLPVSAVLGIVSTRLIIEHFGQAAYAQYGLLVNIGTLLPFADLGMSASIMNAVAVASDPRRDRNLARTLLTSLRVLFASAAVIVVVSVVFGLTGIWRSVLGDALLPGGGTWAATLCLAVVGITIGAGFGQRILTGLGRNYVSVALLGLQTPVVLGALIVMIGFDLPGGTYLAVIPYVVTFGLSLVACWLAARRVAPAVGHALRQAPRVRTVAGASVIHTAWPMLVQMIALPIAMQTDRIVLSHVSSLAQLARYNLAAQMFTPIWAVVSAAGVALWPVFAKAKAKDAAHESPIRMALGFGAAALVMAAVIAAVSPWLADRASGGTIHLDLLLVVSFAVFMVFQALKYPLGMYMTDPKGLRFQAYAIVALLPVNLGLSLALAVTLGAAGPVIGSAVGVFVCQVLANWIYVRRDQRRHEQRRRSALADQPS